jgi:glucosamine-6-phosphate deaminase
MQIPQSLTTFPQSRNGNPAAVVTPEPVSARIRIRTSQASVQFVGSESDPEVSLPNLQATYDLEHLLEGRNTPMATVSTPPLTLRNAQGVRIPTRVFPTSSAGVKHVVMMIENLIRERQSAGLPVVLGLPTGSTPVGVYRELVRLHREEGLDFSNVITFNIDEYFPMRKEEVQSYHRFMHEHFFDHVNIKRKNIHIPDGTIPFEQIEEYCAEYEHKIHYAGGLDLLLLGIGRTGHIGFNEPGSSEQSRTRLVRLDPVTRRDAASAFFGEENVPTHAITMGVGTILEAKKIVLLAFGEHKASVVARTLQNEHTKACPASILQQHDDAVFVIDEPAACDLALRKTPWLLDERIDWTDAMVRKAVLWLAFNAKKALLKLTAEDFRQHNLHELLREHGPVQPLVRRVFDVMMETICDAPAGHEKKRVLCFSPHPDDDVISMGGTLIRLVDHGHDVHIAYMTSGNVAVFDHDALRFANFAADFNELFGLETQRAGELEKKVYDFLLNKRPGQIDSPEVLAIKSLVRKTEATAGAQAICIPERNLHFLDMPFYRTGLASKKSLGEEDILIVYQLLKEFQPHQIYVAGDLADPHGTHRICAHAIFEAVERLRGEGTDFEVWLYRGAWQEWEPHQIERAVPLSPDDLDKKKAAIFRHESQKDRAMFPGNTDKREFWQRAEDRNRGTADLYDQLGLPEYFAMEGFVLWKGDML